MTYCPLEDAKAPCQFAAFFLSELDILNRIRFTQQKLLKKLYITICYIVHIFALDGMIEMVMIFEEEIE